MVAPRQRALMAPRQRPDDVPAAVGGRTPLVAGGVAAAVAEVAAGAVVEKGRVSSSGCVQFRVDRDELGDECVDQAVPHRLAKQEVETPKLPDGHPTWESRRIHKKSKQWRPVKRSLLQTSKDITKE